MVAISFSLSETYWEDFEVSGEDLEFLYNYLIEIETPQSPGELLNELVKDRIQREQKASEKKQRAGGAVYLPKEKYAVGAKLVFPALGGEVGAVTAVRDGKSYGDETFKVIEVAFDEGEPREFATEFSDHKLNDPVVIRDDDPLFSPSAVMATHEEVLSARLTEAFRESDDFVYIAGRWFPQALLIDVNEGNLNLAEAVLDMSGGGPLLTEEILGHVDLPSGVNQNLATFSLDLALQDNVRFDEVGSSGVVSWFLKRLEPEGVLKTPIFLKYSEMEYDRSLLTDEMLRLEKRLYDEFSPEFEDEDFNENDELMVSLIYPHWRSGTLPLSGRLAKMFPSALESPRVQFTLVDGDTGEKFFGWVVRLEKYVYGLSDWYKSRGVMPGSIITLKRGNNPGEIIVNTKAHLSNKEWVRTALVGADGRVVYATLKQGVATEFDDWMMIAMPAETSALDESWEKHVGNPRPFEQVVVNTIHELAKLNPQAHVHAAELYSAVNVVYRCPPGPILALLGSRSWFVHVGDLHFRYEESEE